MRPSLLTWHGVRPPDGGIERGREPLDSWPVVALSEQSNTFAADHFGILGLHGARMAEHGRGEHYARTLSVPHLGCSRTLRRAGLVVGRLSEPEDLFASRLGQGSPLLN